jgi:membrane protein implicated in regulation of membrane protease activity
LISNNLKREYKSIPPRPRNQVLNILVLALMAVALAVGDWLTITQHNPVYFIAAVIISLVIFIAVRRYVSRRM